MQRTYAEVAATANGGGSLAPAPASQSARGQNAGQSLQQQLGSITKQLAQVVSPIGEARASPPEAAGPNTLEDKQALSSQLQQLQASLAALPDCQEFLAVRNQLLKQIEETKTKVSSSKPLGARLDGCRNALERARQRQATAEAALQAATLARDAAKSQVAKYESELAELETLVADEAQKKRSSSCLSRLQKEMHQIVKEMSSSAHVDGTEATVALQQMAALFQNLSGIAAKSQAAATVAAATTPCERARLQQMLQQNASIVPPTVAASAHTYVEALQVAAEIPVGDGDSPMEAVPQTGIALGGG